MSSFLPSSFDFPNEPLGLPIIFPFALAAANPSFVRSEIKSRSISANRPNRKPNLQSIKTVGFYRLRLASVSAANIVIITFVCISCAPSKSILSLTATKRSCCSIMRSTRRIICDTLRPRRLNSLTSKISFGASCSSN